MHELAIAVVGSVNLDIVARVDRFPVPGETLTNATVSRFPGGKGANQALAARRLGARVCMLACVGDDLVAEEALAGLRREGVDLDRCRTLAELCTGLALILVSSEGENQIVVAAGANAAFTPDKLDLPETDAVIAQLEVPIDTILLSAQKAKGFFCLNAAPVRPVPQALLKEIDLLVVNEIEAQAMGSALDTYAGWLAVTHGARGAVLSRNGGDTFNATLPKVEVVDTTGAGDAFTAALTVGMAGGLSPRDALQQACVAGALTASRAGAQSSPLKSEVNSKLEELHKSTQGE